MDKIKKILFISNTASLTGAPLILINFASWLKLNHPDIIIDLLLLDGGDYIDVYKSTFRKVLFLGLHVVKKIPLRVFNYVKSYAGFSNQSLLFKKIKKENYDVLYCNTVVTLVYGNSLKIKIPSAKLFLHVHELEISIDYLEPNFKSLLYNIDHYIAVSNSVLMILINRYKIEAYKISLIHEFVSLKKIDKVKKDNLTFKVGACGFVDWRKGYDLFIMTAHLFTKRYPDVDIAFEWVGLVTPLTDLIIQNDIKKLNLTTTVTFTGQTANPLNAFSEFDVFLLLSREDPFPLVCLEVGNLGVPIIGFANAGGVSELLANGGGIIAPYLDIEEVVYGIYQYFINAEARKKDGEYLRRETEKYSVEILAPKLFKVLLNQFN